MTQLPAIDPKDLQGLTPQELAELDRLLTSGPQWRPLPGPQSMAYESQATVVGFGGSAGGGKTDLALGMALNKHQRILLCRQNGTELLGIVDRLTQMLGTKDGYNGAERIWRTSRWDKVPVQIELGSFPAPGDAAKYQGRPHDLLVFDEASNMRLADVRFLMGWLRTVDPQQPCRALMTFNPPTTSQGRWVIDYFAPWLDKRHPKPAQPGELRYFATMNGRDVEVESAEVIYHDGERIVPQSRTFIPSRISDNPYLMQTGYMAQLQSLPEPLRSQMLYGDFSAGLEDDPWQVIPTSWVEAAQARWKELDVKPQMDSVGVDVARGGRDETVIARRHGNWFDMPIAIPGNRTPDGPTVAGQVISNMRDQACVHIDVIGVGSSPYDFLVQSGIQCIGVNVSESATGLDASGRLKFKNQRSQLWWNMREALDPARNLGIQLPPNQRLLADLTSATWSMSGSTIQVASRDEIKEVIGRSPDYASAYLLALMDTPTRREVDRLLGGRDRNKRRADYDPYKDLGWL
jgi:hypothetical protein